MLSLLMKDETADQIHIEQRKIFNYKLGSGCAVPTSKQPLIELEPATASGPEGPTAQMDN